MTRTRTLAAPLLLLTTIVNAALADDVVLTTGETLTGEVRGERLSIQTGQGRLDAPFAAIVRADVYTDGTARVELVDGTVIEGALVQREIVLGQGLLDRTLQIEAVRSVIWSPPATTIPAGTIVPLELIRTVSSASATAGRAVSFCVTTPVVIEGQTVIQRFAPAEGSVLGSGGGRNVDGGGALVLSAGAVSASDGSRVPLSGTLEARGGFDASALAGGVLGLLGEGRAAVAPSGLVFEAKTADAVRVALRAGVSTPEKQDAWVLCQDYYRFRGVEVIPLEDVDWRRSYAPVPQPLRLSVPLREIVGVPEFTKGRVEKLFRTRALLMDGVFLASLSVDASAKRKRSAYLTVQTTIEVLPSHDRWVSLRYELLADGRRVKILSDERLDAEERKQKTSKTRIDLSEGEVEALLAASDARLQITMTAIDN